MISPNNFISTKNIYENYNAVITRTFFKISKLQNKKLKEILTKNEIEKLLNKNFLQKFSIMVFDKYYGEYGLNIDKSIRIILNKIGSDKTDIDSFEYSKLGLKWEKFVDDVIVNRYKNAIIHKKLDNNLIPDIAFITKNNECKKIIECKLNISYDELYETIRKYSKYCDTLEIWGLSKSRFDYRNIDIELICNAMKKYYYDDIEKDINKNIKLKILCYDDIEKKISNKEKEILKLLYNEYSNIGGDESDLDPNDPLETRISYINHYDLEDIEEKIIEEITINYEPFLKELDISLDIENNIYINNAIKNNLKYKIKSSDYTKDFVINGVIELCNLRKFKIPIQYYKDEKKSEYENISYLELEFKYENKCSYTIYEVIFDKLYLIDNNKNEYECIRGHYMTYPLKRNCHIKEFDIFKSPQEFKTNVPKNTKIYYKIPNNFELQELKLKISGSKKEEIRLIKENDNINLSTEIINNFDKKENMHNIISSKKVSNKNYLVILSIIILSIALLLLCFFTNYY